MAIDKGLYVAMTGAQAMLRAQATVANNLANKDSTGFKAGRVHTESFSVPGMGLPSRIAVTEGNGGFDSSSGAFTSTGNASDIALRENVWLGVSANDGSEAYTRAGDLRISAEGLVTTSGGRPVLTEAGAPLSLPPHAQLHIGSDGTVSVQTRGQGPEALTMIGRLRLAEVADARELKRGEDGLMRIENPPPQATGNAVTSGFLESSNVDSAGCLVQMIELSRAFELQVKLIRSGEEMARSSTSLLRMNG